jgi:signal transduction histidine kinase
MRASREILENNRGEIVTGLVLLVALYLTSQRSYLLFHSLIELFTIVVATGIFVITWNARRNLTNNYLVFVGLASLFVAFLDLLHTLAYEGMGVFSDRTGNLATQLWIGGRLLQSASFLVAPLLLGRVLRVRFTLGLLAAVTVLLVLAIFRWHVFPIMYVDGVGLTAVKKGAEYVVSFTFLVAIGLLIRRRQEFDPSVVRLLAAALLLLIASEVTFTFYLSLYGETNMAGHMLRLMGSYALYKAIIETGLERPYALLLRDLKHSKEKLEEYAAALEARNEALIRSEQRLQEDAGLLRQRNTELDAYAHTVAHDLKNPLSVIISAGELMSEVDHLPQARREELLGEIRSTALHMGDIVDDLLMLSEVRRVNVPSEPVDMGAVVANVCRRLSVMIRQHDARVTLPAEWPIPMGYAPWIEEVWANLVSNAVKYGGFPPHVELGATREGTERVRFWVRDDGPGVDPEVRRRLFVPFEQVEKVRKPGHGLGLSIVLRIVNKLGGEVGVESEPGRGSLFSFVLPAVGGQSPPAPPAPAGGQVPVGFSRCPPNW